MKLTIAAIILGLVCSVVAEDKPMKKETKKEIAVSTEKNLNVKDLPAKVQASIKKVCKGEISTIQAVKADKKMNYKVTCKNEMKKKVYLFDAEGNTIK
ncbi:MAG: hypothetical protein NE327_09865 [Lentisphaeraceae bacterium]|nr:hypothetical protein [Lentisphaeraceae bacterium]